MYDERFYRLWQFYLAASLTMFRDAPMGVYQTPVYPQAPRGDADHPRLYVRGRGAASR